MKMYKYFKRKEIIIKTLKIIHIGWRGGSVVEMLAALAKDPGLTPSTHNRLVINL